MSDRMRTATVDRRPPRQYGAGMKPPHAATPAADIDLLHAWGLLERARVAADPRESPVALLIDKDGAAGARLLRELGSAARSLVENGQGLCGWVPRAEVARALGRVDALEALRLERAPATDVGVWTVVHAARTCVVAEQRRARA